MNQDKGRFSKKAGFKFLKASLSFFGNCYVLSQKGPKFFLNKSVFNGFVGEV